MPSTSILFQESSAGILGVSPQIQGRHTGTTIGGAEAHNIAFNHSSLLVGYTGGSDIFVRICNNAYWYLY